MKHLEATFLNYAVIARAHALHALTLNLGSCAIMADFLWLLERDQGNFLYGFIQRLVRCWVIIKIILCLQSVVSVLTDKLPAYSHRAYFVHDYLAFLAVLGKTLLLFSQRHHVH